MKILLVAFLVFGSISSFAEANCKKELSDLKKNITSYERNTISVIDYLNSVGEYILERGTDLQSAYQIERTVTKGDYLSLKGSGKTVIDGSKEATEDNNQLVNEINLKLNALEDCIKRK